MEVPKLCRTSTSPRELLPADVRTNFETGIQLSFSEPLQNRSLVHRLFP